MLLQIHIPFSFNWKTAAAVGTMTTQKLCWGCKFIDIRRCEELIDYFYKVKDSETFTKM